MNLILVDSSEVGEGGRVVLAGRRARHICKILRAAPGDRLRIGLIRGPMGVGEVCRVDHDCVDMLATWEVLAEKPPAVELVLAVPRPKVLPRVLQTAASMGVRRIDLVNAWRVEKSYLHSQHLDAAELRTSALLGCEQGGTTWVPEIAVHRLLMPFLRGPLTERVRAEHGPGQTGCSIIAHPRAERMIESAVTPAMTGPVLAAIGPEPGWIERELDSFIELGFVPVAMGPRVLRVDTAVAALLAQIELLRRL